MSFDLAVWRPTEQLNAESASRFYADLCSRPFQSFVPGVEMQDFVNAVVERYSALRGTSDPPWAAEPDIGEDCALMPIQSALAADVSPIIRGLARARRLVCFDPQRSVVVYQPASENVVAFNPLTLELSDGRVIDGPTDALIEVSVRGLSEVNWFVVLERRENYFIQAGYGDKAGVPRGNYAIEYRDGSPEMHWRTLSSSLNELVSAFLEYSRGDMEWTRAFAWMPLDADG
jgi:hypothetical protein